MPPEDTLMQSYGKDPEIAKSKKVVALTKSVFAALLIFLFFFSVGSTMVILKNQEQAADRILNCSIPTGGCYKAKVKDSQLKNAVQLLSIVEFCSNLNPSSVEAMEKCINQEIVSQP